MFFNKVLSDDFSLRILEENVVSLRKQLEDSKVDQIEDDQEFVEAEYDVIQTYCEICGYSITEDDLIIIKSRGLEECFMDWQETYIKDLNDMEV